MNAPAYGTRTRELAAMWGLSLRTAQKWLSATPPVPLDSVEATLRWVASLPAASQSKLTRAFRVRVDEHRVAAERPAATSPDTDYATFLHDRAAASAAPGSTARTTGPLEKLKLQRDYALHQIELGNRRRDPALVKDATDTLKRLHDAIYDEETLNARLGRDLGDIIPRADYERQLRALAYWLVRTVDDAKAALAPRLAAASAHGPLYRQEVDAILEPVLLTTRVLDPLRRSADLPPGTGAALPPWALNALRTALAACLENPDQPDPSKPSDPSKPLVNAITGDAGSQGAAPSVSAPDGQKPAGAATASHSPLGSVSAQPA